MALTARFIPVIEMADFEEPQPSYDYEYWGSAGRVWVCPKCGQTYAWVHLMCRVHGKKETERRPYRAVEYECEDCGGDPTFFNPQVWVHAAYRKIELGPQATMREMELVLKQWGNA